MTINYKKCPECGSKNSIPILYGMPSYDMFEEAEAGKIKLGGCCIIEGYSPDFFCKDCEYEWNSAQAINQVYKKIKGINATVGGYIGSSYLVKIDLVGCTVAWIQWEQGKEINTYQKKIKAETAERFIDQLKSVNLLDWKRIYENPGVLDGTGWQVEIYKEGRDLVKSGDNAFPNEWDTFCSIIGKVANRRFR